jgi:Domain of unknown function (DUF4136)
MWLERPESENPLMDDRIVNAVNAQLSAKGLERVTTDADLSVSATWSVQEKHIVNTLYDDWGWGWGWGWNGPGWATTYVHTYREGTTVVELTDTASEKVIWQGVSTGSVSDKPEKAARKISKVISEMFESYPSLRARFSD